MTDLWYYTSGGRQMEPVSAAELRRLAAEGNLKPTDMVWREGMPRWVRASSTEFFAGATPGLTGAESLPVRPLDREEPAPRPKRRREADDVDDRPTRRKPAKRGAAGVAVVLAIVVGAGLLLLVVAVGAVILISGGAGGNHPALVASGPVNPGPANGAPVTFTVALQQGRQEGKQFALRANVRYEITVRNDQGQNGPDLDVHILDGRRTEAEDILPDSEARLIWQAKRSQAYTIAVTNCGPGFGRGTVTIREFDTPQGNAGGPAAEESLPPGVRAGGGVVRLDSVAPGAEHVFKLQLKAGQEASLRLLTHQPREGADVRLSLLRDADGKEVASAEAVGPNRELKHTPAATGVFRVRVHNAGAQPARVTVMH